MNALEPRPEKTGIKPMGQHIQESTSLRSNRWKYGIIPIKDQASLLNEQSSCGNGTNIRSAKLRKAASSDANPTLNSPALMQMTVVGRLFHYSRDPESGAHTSGELNESAGNWKPLIKPNSQPFPGLHRFVRHTRHPSGVAQAVAPSLDPRHVATIENTICNLRSKSQRLNKPQIRHMT